MCHNIDRFLLCNSFAQLEGAYLYYDTNLGEFVRRSKVTWQCFSVRHEAHEKKSNERNASSRFYFLFPSEEEALQNTRRKQGEFQSLKQYIAAGFDLNSTVTLTLDKGHNNGGILILNNDDINNIQSSMKQHPCHLLKFMFTLPTSLNLVKMLPLSPLWMCPVIQALNLSLECLVHCHVVLSYDVVRGW